MSGIGGIFTRRQDIFDPRHLQAMARAMAHRGPDGITLQNSQYAGLLHCMLHDTPESLIETLPAQSQHKQLTITWHGRIDNREELRDKIGWTKPLLATPDSALILAAYEKWNRDCVYHLLGDFSFAISDATTKTVFCARDHMGVKPFFYFLTGSVFAFASEIKGLFPVPGCDRTINEDRIADYLASVITENSSTFYKNIFRLPPGHFLEVTPERHSIEQYWKPHPMELNCKNDQEYQEQFYSIFEEAVRCRLRSAFPVGSLLSGGLDSSSIVCMAAGPLKTHLKSPLHTFSGVFDTITECDEREYFHDIIKKYELAPHSVTADEIDPGIAYDAAYDYADEPFFVPHFFMPDALLRAARSAGTRIVLDGHDGDAAVSYGFGLLYELFTQYHWIHLLQEFYGIQKQPSFRKGLKFCFRITKHATFSKLPLSFQQHYFTRETDMKLSLLNPEFIRQNNLLERFQKQPPTPPRFSQPELHCHLRNISSPLQPLALEFMDMQNVRYDIEGRYPFFDSRLISFCLALPATQKLSQGFNRNIVRKSLSPLLPEIIRRRKSKTDFSPNFRYLFSTLGKSWLRFHIDRFHKDVYYYINKDKSEEIYRYYLHKPSNSSILDLGYLLRCISLADWLENK